MAVVRPRLGEVIVLGPIERLDLGGSYDPGGLERVEFLELDDGDLLVIHEIGLLRISSNGTLRWQETHDDLGARPAGIDGEVIWLETETERFGFELRTGKPRFEGAEDPG
jgi:hypothetical protein